MTDITREEVFESLSEVDGRANPTELTEGFVPRVKCDECGHTKNSQEFTLARATVREHLQSLERDGKVRKCNALDWVVTE